MRANIASDVCTSRPTDSSDWSGNSRRVWSVVKATTVPIDSTFPPRAMLSPANQ